MYIYDLKHAPASFDFLAWLANCATEAQGPFEVGIRRGPANGFRDDNLEPRDTESRLALLENVMLPLTRLYPVSRLEVFTEAEDGERMTYLARGLLNGNEVTSLRVPDWALNRVRRRYPVPPVVLNIRNAHYHACRNSNLAEWLKVKEALEARGLPVVMVGDGFNEFEWDSVILRAALFEHADAVLGVNAGTMGLAVYNERARYCVFKPLADTPASTADWWASRIGVVEGGEYPWALRHQKIIWEDDNADAILAAYDALPARGGEFGRAWIRQIFESSLNTPMETMIDQAEQNLKLDLPLFIEQPENKGEAIIVGGGPSLVDNLMNLHFHKRRGGVVFALNGAHDWLIERGIIPDFHILLDARPGNVDFVKKPRRDVTYLIAVQCHPSIFEALKGFNVIQWVSCTDSPQNDQVLAARHPGKPLMMVGGGATVGMKAMNIAYLWGFRRLAMYGFDSSYSGNQNHAYPQPLNAGEKQILVRTLGMSFTCAPWMAKQAEEFERQFKQLSALGVKISVHGRGLIPHIYMCLTKEAA